MDNEFIKLKKEFEKIKEKGWIKSIRKGPTGIGKTFETLIGKEEESFSIPDYYGIEIKTRRNSTSEPVSLFCVEPDGEGMFESERIRLKYGYSSKKYPQFTVFNASIKSNAYTQIGNNKFILQINHSTKTLYLTSFNSSGKMIDKSTSWSFKLLQECLERKLNYLAIIRAYNKHVDGEEYFKYTKMTTYKNVIFENFIHLLEKGKIIVNFKIGVFTGSYRFG